MPISHKAQASQKEKGHSYLAQISVASDLFLQSTHVYWPTVTPILGDYKFKHEQSRQNILTPGRLLNIHRLSHFRFSPSSNVAHTFAQTTCLFQQLLYIRDYVLEPS